MIVSGWPAIEARIAARGAVDYLTLTEELTTTAEEGSGTVRVRPLNGTTLALLRPYLNGDDMAEGADQSSLPSRFLAADDSSDEEDVDDDEAYEDLFVPERLVRAGAEYLRDLAVANTLEASTRWKMRSYAERQVTWKLRFSVVVDQEPDHPPGAGPVPEPSLPTSIPKTPMQTTPAAPQATLYGEPDTEFDRMGARLVNVGDHWDRFGEVLAKHLGHLLELQSSTTEKIAGQYSRMFEIQAEQNQRLGAALGSAHKTALDAISADVANRRNTALDHADIKHAEATRELVGHLAKDGVTKLGDVITMLAAQQLGDMDPKLAKLATVVAGNPALTKALGDPDLIAVLEDPAMAASIADTLGGIAVAFAEAKKAEAAAEAAAQAQRAAEAQARAEHPAAAAGATTPPGAPASGSSSSQADKSVASPE
jgi:hypothetical protein